ncbi:Guanine nucleotide binding protein (G protein) beta other [Paragonimus heterotremus]|uniref:Guanine nucleotide binding protein (G protein) beta other n=1 Tax=Paragonimus heterotremus TaxID=100268 RepID=A0A8J4SFU7_9TREM|nr:Guanine nucleotide binding protein (G protein) beta other [Paragonimus heterotremus]
MKPNDVELKLLSEIMTLKDRLSQIRNGAREYDLSQLIRETNLHVFSRIPTLSPVHHLRAHTSKVHDVVWTPSDKFLITVGGEGLIVVWETQSGMINNVLDVSGVQPITAAASDDARKLYCGGLCANVVLFTSQHRPAEDGYSEYETVLVYEHSGQVNCIIRPDESQLLTAATSDGVLLWDAEQVKVVSRFPQKHSTVCCLSLMTTATQGASTFVTGASDGTIRLWDLRQPGTMVSQFESHESDVCCVRPLPNGLNFVSGSEDTAIHLYDLRTDIVLSRFSDPQPPSQMQPPEDEIGQMTTQSDVVTAYQSASVCDIAVSASGRMLISGCKDSGLYYWDLTQQDRCVHRETESGPVIRLAMSNQKHAMAMLTWDAKSRIRIMRPR